MPNSNRRYEHVPNPSESLRLLFALKLTIHQLDPDMGSDRLAGALGEIPFPRTSANIGLRLSRMASSGSVTGWRTCSVRGAG